jgi:cell division protein FtsN
LKELGYKASIVDTTSGGLYVVSMQGFNNYNEAVNQLSEIKKNGFPASWILKKQKG